MRCLLSTCLMIHAACVGLTAALPAPPSAPLTLRLDPYFRAMKTLSLTLEGRELRFLVDTGGGISLISAQVAKELGRPPWGKTTGHRMDGSAVVLQWCQGGTFKTGGWSTLLSPVAVLDLGSVIPKELPPLDGVLALDAFRGQVVTFDWAKGLLRIESPASAAEALRQHGLPLRFATGMGGAELDAMVPIRQGGRTWWFLLDSGCDEGTLATPYVRENLGTETPSLLGRTEKLIVRDLCYDGVLGNHWMAQGPVTLDLRQAPPAQER